MNKDASTYDAFFKRIFAHEPNCCLNGEITAVAHIAYSSLHSLMAYFWNFLTKIKNMEAHLQTPKKIPIVYSSTEEVKPTISKHRNTPRASNR